MVGVIGVYMIIVNGTHINVICNTYYSVLVLHFPPGIYIRICFVNLAYFTNMSYFLMLSFHFNYLVFSYF